MATAMFGDLGAPVSTQSSFSKIMASAMAYNKKQSSLVGWYVKETSHYSGPGDKALALAIFCYQHNLEGCKGSCSETAILSPCADRDGKLGPNTLKALKEDIKKGGFLAKLWSTQIGFGSPKPQASNHLVASGTSLPAVVTAPPAQVTVGGNPSLFERYKAYARTKKGRLVLGVTYTSLAVIAGGFLYLKSRKSS